MHTFSAGDIWLAIRRHTRTDRGMFRPQLADILAGLDANEREMTEARHAQESAARQLQSRRRGGHSAPPEFRAALEIHKEASRPDVKPEDRAQAAAMIDALADQLDTRAAGRPETVTDATRTCPGCADSPMTGRVVAPPDEDARGVAVATLKPCPDCSPGRFAAWQQGTLHAKPRAKETST